MGTLYYGSSGEPIEIEDQLLAYLKVVIAVKLRRNEAFTLTWKHGPGAPPRRSMLWLQPSIPLRFVFDAEAPDALNRGYLERLMQQANSTAGVTVDLGDLDAIPAAPERHATSPELSAAAS